MLALALSLCGSQPAAALNLQELEQLRADAYERVMQLASKYFYYLLGTQAVMTEQENQELLHRMESCAALVPAGTSDDDAMAYMDTCVQGLMFPQGGAREVVRAGIIALPVLGLFLCMVRLMAHRLGQYHAKRLKID